MADTKLIILAIAIPLLLLFFLACAIYIFFKFCRGRKTDEDREYLLGGDGSSTSNLATSSSSALTSNPSYDSMSLMDKVNMERKQSISKSKETAYVYLQFYFRSNPDKTYKLIEQMTNIGSQNETDRSWFLVKETVNDVNKYKIIFINGFESATNAKKNRLVEIADSMSISIRELEVLIGGFLTSIKHNHVLSFDTVEVNFDKDRILFVQNYSKDGSLRDLIRRTKPEESWDVKSRALESKSSISIKTVREYTKQIIAGLIYLNKRLVFPMDNFHSGNIILAINKRVCLLTGFESIILLNKSRIDRVNEKSWVRVVKSYLLRAKSGENDDEIVTRKAKNDLELKEIIQVLRVGLLVIEMCLGVECEELLPGEQYFNEIVNSYKATEANEIVKFLRFLFYNKQIIDDKNGKTKGINNFEVQLQ